MKLLLVLVAIVGFLASPAITPEELSRDLEKKIGEEVTFTDDLLWKTPKQELEGYVKFETTYLRCILASDKAEDLKLLEALLSERAPRRATITGTPVMKKDLQAFVEVTSIQRPSYEKEMN